MFIVVRYGNTKLDFLIDLIEKPEDLIIFNYGDSIESNVRIYNNNNFNYGYLVSILEFLISNYENLPENIIMFHLDESIDQSKLFKNLKNINRKIQEKNYNILNPISFCHPILSFLNQTNEIIKYSNEIIKYNLDLRMVLPIWEKSDIMVLNKENLLKRSLDNYQLILEDLKKNPINITNFYLLFGIITGY